MQICKWAHTCTQRQFSLLPFLSENEIKLWVGDRVVGIHPEGLWHPFIHHRNSDKRLRKGLPPCSPFPLLAYIRNYFCSHSTDPLRVSTVGRHMTLCIRIVKFLIISCHSNWQSSDDLTDMCGLPRSHVKTTVWNYNLPEKVRNVIKGYFHITTP